MVCSNIALAFLSIYFLLFQAHALKPRLNRRFQDDTAPKDYKDYKLYRINPRNQENLEYLKDLFAHDSPYELDFWQAPTHIGGLVDVTVNPEDAKIFARDMDSKQLDYTVAIDDLQQSILGERNSNITNESGVMRDSSAFRFDKYNTIERIENYLQKLEMENPSLITLIDIGKTHENRSLTVVKIGARKPYGCKKIGFWIDGSIHAREWISPATALIMIDKLVKGYKSDAVIQNYLDNVDFYILPVMNPDGYAFSHTSNRLWRRNRSPAICKKNYFHTICCAGVDLNRNFDWFWASTGSSSDLCHETYHGSSAFSEPETRSVKEFLEKTPMKAFVSLHSYSQLWLIPYSHRRRSYPQDYATNLRPLAMKATKAIYNLHGTKYAVGTGADLLYEASGSSVDYAKGVLKIPYSFLIELRPKNSMMGNGFLLPETEIVETGEETFEAMKVITDELIGQFGTPKDTKCIVKPTKKRTTTEKPLTTEEIISTTDIITTEPVTEEIIATKSVSEVEDVKTTNFVDTTTENLIEATTIEDIKTTVKEAETSTAPTDEVKIETTSEAITKIESKTEPTIVVRPREKNIIPKFEKINGKSKVRKTTTTIAPSTTEEVKKMTKTITEPPTTEKEVEITTTEQIVETTITEKNVEPTTEKSVTTGEKITTTTSQVEIITEEPKTTIEETTTTVGVKSSEVSATSEVRLTTPEISTTKEVKVTTPEISTTEEVKVTTPEISTTEEVKVTTPEISTTEKVKSTNPEIATTEEIKTTTPVFSTTDEVKSTTPEITSTKKIEETTTKVEEVTTKIDEVTTKIDKTTTNVEETTTGETTSEKVTSAPVTDKEIVENIILIENKEKVSSQTEAPKIVESTAELVTQKITEPTITEATTEAITTEVATTPTTTQRTRAPRTRQTRFHKVTVLPPVTVPSKYIHKIRPSHCKDYTSYCLFYQIHGLCETRPKVRQLCASSCLPECQ
uniref:Peptidase_M14 domain-containing protein n=1 Tax=Rhabditophanes sp. KR3021 TaxID=114890 RepID=A0AC35UAK9_9BILA